MLDILTLVRGRYCDGLCCELVIEVTRVRLRCYLRLEGRNELRRRKEVLLHSETLILNVFFYLPVPHLFFKNILPVDGGEELVDHHFFGVVWSASEPANKTKTPSSFSSDR